MSSPPHLPIFCPRRLVYFHSCLSCLCTSFRQFDLNAFRLPSMPPSLPTVLPLLLRHLSVLPLLFLRLPPFLSAFLPAFLPSFLPSFNAAILPIIRPFFVPFYHRASPSDHTSVLLSCRVTFTPFFFFPPLVPCLPCSPSSFASVPSFSVACLFSLPAFLHIVQYFLLATLPSFNTSYYPPALLIILPTMLPCLPSFIRPSSPFLPSPSFLLSFFLSFNASILRCGSAAFLQYFLPSFQPYLRTLKFEFKVRHSEQHTFLM